MGCLMTEKVPNILNERLQARLVMTKTVALVLHMELMICGFKFTDFIEFYLLRKSRSALRSRTVESTKNNPSKEEFSKSGTKFPDQVLIHKGNRNSGLSLPNLESLSSNATEKATANCFCLVNEAFSQIPSKSTSELQ